MSDNLSPAELDITLPKSEAHDSRTPVAPPFVGETPPDAAPTKLDQRGYELIETLGAGGMGEVYRCCDPALGRDLAIKVMKAELRRHPAVERRFLREARITAFLQHPGIVPVHNLGRLADGRFHYTMRLVGGQTFAAILKEEAGKPERLPYLLSIFEKICQTVAYAHSKRVIHRDLKPSNVMVGRFGEVQVMDWGLAKILNAEDESEITTQREETRIHTEVGNTSVDLTRAGQEMGTPAYMPPEQSLAEWDAVDERADVFALGAILCEMLTGQPPYTGRDSAEALRKAKRGNLTEALARLDSCNADAALMKLCRDSLAPAREDRPRDAEQVAQRVTAYQADAQERLRQTELERRAAVIQAREERKRRRWMLAATGVLLAGVAVSTWLAVWAADAAKAERQANELAQNRLEQSKKANEVLASIFRDLDPRAEDGGGTSLRVQMAQHVEKASAQLDDLAIDDPLTAAHLRYTLGRSLGVLGRTQQAIAQLGQAYRIQESKLGPDDADTLESMLELGMAYHADNQLDKSVAILEQLLERQQRKFGPNHPTTLQAMSVLAGIYLATHQFDKVEPFVGALEAQHAVGELEDLAMAYRLTGQMEKSLRLSLLVVKLRKAKDGPDDPKTLDSMTGLAASYRSVGQEKAAIQLYEEVLPKQQAKLPPDHRNTLTTMENLGLAYCACGQVEKGLALMEQSWEKWKAKFGPSSPTAQPRRLALAMAYERVGNSRRAESLLREGLDLQRAKGSQDSVTTLRFQAILGVNLLHQHKYSEAESVLRDCLKIRETKQPSDWETYHARSALGEALLVQKKYDEAEKLLLHGYEGLKQHQNKIPPKYRQLHLSEARERLVRFYEETGKKDETAKWREEPRP
jgi:serine/threonine protein kinase